jgi:rhodanese-related sulfurtransferase
MTIPLWDVDQYIIYNDNVMIVDLRSPFSYERGHLKGAVNLPYEQFDSWKNQLPKK